MKKIVTVLLGIAAIGCQQEEKHEAKVPGSLFSAEDLTKGNVSDLDADDVEYAINDSSVAEPGNSGGQGGFSLQSDDCVDDVFNTLTAGADEANLTVRGALDFKHCFQDNPDFSVSKAEANVLFYVGCDDGKLKEFNGRSIKDLEDADGGCRDSETTKVIANAEIFIEGAESFEDGEGNEVPVEVGLRVLTATQSEGGACEAKHEGGNVNWNNHCFSLERSYFTKLLVNGQSSGTDANEDFLKAQFENIVERDASGFQWYESGKFLVELNNWKGEVVFNGAQNAPTWTMSNGTTTSSGSLGSGMGLSLKEKTRQRISAIFRK